VVRFVRVQLAAATSPFPLLAAFGTITGRERGGAKTRVRGIDLAAGTGAWAIGFQAWEGTWENPAATTKSRRTASSFGFTGREHEGDSGLVYARERWLSSASGLFTAPDPSGMPDGPNRYAYTRSPALRIDPLGLAPEAPWFLRAYGAVFTSARRIADELTAYALAQVANVAIGQVSACEVAAKLVELATIYTQGVSGWHSTALALLFYAYENPFMFKVKGSSGFKYVFKAIPEDDDNVHHAVGTLGGVAMFGEPALIHAVRRDLHQYHYGQNAGSEGELHDIALDYAAYELSAPITFAWNRRDSTSALRLAWEKWCTRCDD
jgi:RHS repeat-associated protein